MSGITQRLPRAFGLDGSFRLAAALRGRLRLALMLGGLLVLGGLVRGTPGPVTGTPSAALVAYLAQRGMSADAADVAWLAAPAGPLALRPVVFLAARAGELRDLYYADVRASSDGRVLGVWFLTNVTRTSSADEALLVHSDDAVVYAARLGAGFDALVRLELRGESTRVTQGWPLRARLQNRLTNLQETGRSAGFGRVRYHFAPAAERLSLRAEPGRFVADVDGERVVIDAHQSAPLEGASRVRVSPQVKGQPGTITWLVDSVRNVSWIGSAPVEWLEHHVFSLTDRANRSYHGVVGTDTEAEVRAALSVAELPAEQQALLTVTDPELGWPPAPLEPQLERRVRGEGEWLPVINDPFVNQNEQAPPAFYQTFLRVDPERDFTRVYVTLWDPRQVQLHIAMGTREPQSATGETGTGMIPRDPELLRRLVGGFNGGFQALHGEFGMMSERQVYLPPKPWAATVAVFEDGHVGMGSWPGPERRRDWDEESANQQIPSDMIAMRQNLTSVVEDGVYNPWERWWWGAAPDWTEEQTYIHRSGLCLTREGFMAYLWGESMGPEELGRAMLALRCVRGMHLDMNSKHTGFEFYRPYSEAQPAPPLTRELSEAEFDGTAPGMRGLSFRARKAVTTMSPLRFPRYLERDPRDFFFLALKSVLPGPQLQIGDEPVEFSSSGLPHAGWPHAFARARVGGAAESGGVWLVRIDPARAVPSALGVAAAPPASADGAPGPEGMQPSAAVLGILGPTGKTPGAAQQPETPEGALALQAQLRRARAQYAIAPATDTARDLLRGPRLEPGSGARAALGVDPHGFLLYAEASEGHFDALALRMREAGVELAIALPPHYRLGFDIGGQVVGVDGVSELGPRRQGGLQFAAPAHEAAEVIFPDTAPMPYRRWGGLQGQRVRYFPNWEPRFKAPPEAI